MGFTPPNFVNVFFFKYQSGQIITTSAEVTLNGGLVRESPKNPLNSGLGIILICPESVYLCLGTSIQPMVMKEFSPPVFWITLIFNLGYSQSTGFFILDLATGILGKRGLYNRHIPGG